MRLWQDVNGALLTDEQVLRYVASFGGLKKAFQAGDIKLIGDWQGKAAVMGCGTPANQDSRPKLADYLKELG